MRHLLLSFFLVRVLLGAQDWESRFRVQPHHYSGVRGKEPRDQVIGLGKVNYYIDRANYHGQVSLHLESETLGRRDVSLDIDRAWLRFPLAHSSASITVGRIHPWDLSKHPDANRPFGYLGAGQPQNLGLQLGYGYGAGMEPEPILLGYLGAHYWSNETDEAPWRYGISITPLFVPTLGNEVSFSDGAPASVGRFARRPPGTVEVNGVAHPIYLEIDRSRLIQDVLIQPQFFAQLAHRSDSYAAHLSLFRAPSAEPNFDSSDYLRVTDDSVAAVAVVRPQFPQTWGLNLRQDLTLNSDLSLFLTAQALESGWMGGELGFESSYFSFSYSDEFRFKKDSSRLRTEAARLTDGMFQAHFRWKNEDFHFSTGGLTHLRSPDLWYRIGVGIRTSREARLDLLADLFTGTQESYFGEWRTNDRLMLVLTWDFER